MKAKCRMCTAMEVLDDRLNRRSSGLKALALFLSASLDDRNPSKPWTRAPTEPSVHVTAPKLEYICMLSQTACLLCHAGHEQAGQANKHLQHGAALAVLCPKVLCLQLVHLQGQMCPYSFTAMLLFLTAGVHVLPLHSKPHRLLILLQLRLQLHFSGAQELKSR